MFLINVLEFFTTVAIAVAYVEASMSFYLLSYNTDELHFNLAKIRFSSEAVRCLSIYNK